MPLIPISSIYTAVLGLLYIFLCYRIIRLRLSQRVGLGFPTSELKIAGRVQGNAAEYLPITLILLIAAELNGANQASLHLTGLALILARVMHAYGFTSSKGGIHAGRTIGTALNWIIIVSLSLLNVSLSFRYLS